MSKNTRNALELKKLIPSELLSVYEIGTTSLLDDIRENDVLTPITLSKDGIPLDGYRCLFAAIEIGIEEVPVRITDLETSAANRVVLNLKRDKTWNDKRNELVISFQTFGKNKVQRMLSDMTDMQPLQSVYTLDTRMPKHFDWLKKSYQKIAVNFHCQCGCLTVIQT